DYERLSEDQHLQELADCTYEVIRPIYRLGLRESMLFRKDREHFCSRYSQLLEQAGVFISPWYLIRKLRHHARLAMLLRRLLPLRRCLFLPPFPDGLTLEDSQRWVQNFQKRNAQWCGQRQRLAEDLYTFCWGAMLALNEGHADAAQKKSLLRRIKFA